MTHLPARSRPRRPKGPEPPLPRVGDTPGPIGEEGTQREETFGPSAVLRNIESEGHPIVLLSSPIVLTRVPEGLLKPLEKNC